MKWLKILFIAFVMIFIFVPNLSAGPFDCTRNSWFGMYGHGNYWYGGILMWLVFFVIIGFIVYFAVRNNNSGNYIRTDSENPLEILKKRYARGDITEEEFNRIKKDIQR